MMNPNSANQLWSKWIITVRPPKTEATLGRYTTRVMNFDAVKSNAARFMRKAFGEAATMRVRQFPKAWVFEVMAEGQKHPHDNATFTYFSRAFTDFFSMGFGARTDVLVKAKLLAGVRLDGGAPDQLIMLPTIPLFGDKE